MKVKIVTAIYNGLFGTDLGGRPGRNNPYKYSLKSLLQMSNADFVCYTSENDIEDLKNFFYKTHGFTEDRIKFKIYDLRKHHFADKINKLKNLDETKKSDRCFEIQYAKFVWLANEYRDNDEGYDYLYWFDAGLSHNGLIPFRHLIDSSEQFERLHTSPLFNDKFLNNLIKHSGDKITIITKNNTRHFWSQTIPKDYYSDYSKELHVIGGFFGGEIEKVYEYLDNFNGILEILLTRENKLYFEEQIMTFLYYEFPELFNTIYFDLWWHEDQIINGISNMKEYIGDQKSFYRILEELNN